MRTEEEIKALKTVQEKLKECKDEWLEKNAKGQPALGVLTVQQILDNAVQGVTTWDFRIEEQWREEVNKFNKQSGQWIFDGYVYHVRGHLSIEGIGTRTQYGSKVAIGGKDNQNSSYKSAASDCLKKCASLFGVGSSIYSKIKIETEEEQWAQQNQQNASYDYNQQQLQNQQQYNQQQQQQAQQPQQITLPNGDIQQGEYIWSNGQWVHQTQYLVQNGGQYPSPSLTQEQRSNWTTEVMRQYDPQGYNQMMTEQQRQAQEMDRTIAEVDREVANGGIDYPFENVPPKQETQQQAQPQQQAQEQSYQAQPQAEAQQQQYQATPNVSAVGAPVGAPVEPQKTEPKKEVDPLANVQANNPWDNPENVQELSVFQQHKERLGVKKDADLLPHVREYFKDANAGINSITPDTLKGFNTYLQNIAV
jgi:hypothetical protein